MLSNGSVERNDVGNWEIGSEEPNCAYNARALASPFFDAAVGEDRENAQTENRQIFRVGGVTPALARPVIIRLENCAFHVQVCRENHQAPVIAKRPKHECGTDRCAPVFTPAFFDALAGKLVTAGVDSENTDGANHGHDFRFVANAVREGERVNEKQQNPDTGDLPRAKGKEGEKSRAKVKRKCQPRWLLLL